MPFDSDRKRMITVHDVSDPAGRGYLSVLRSNKLKGWDVIAVKGAPDVVLDLCTQYQAIER